MTRAARHRHRLIAALVAALALGGVANAETPPLAPGQEWSVKDTSAKVVIARIDRVGTTDVVNVSVVEVPTPRGLLSIGQAPFQKAALVASLDRLLAVGVAPNPAFAAGYLQWKAGRGGFVTLSVAQTLAATLKTTHPAPLRGR